MEVESEKLQETNEEVRQWEFCFFFFSCNWTCLKILHSSFCRHFHSRCDLFSKLFLTWSVFLTAPMFAGLFLFPCVSGTQGLFSSQDLSEQ